jgi:hypothetical protein
VSHRRRDYFYPFRLCRFFVVVASVKTISQDFFRLKARYAPP